MPTTRAPLAQLPAGLPHLQDQATRLVGLGVHELAGLGARDLCERARGLQTDVADGPALLVMSPQLVPASLLAPLLCSADGKAGFVVEDMCDVDLFLPLGEVHVPDSPVYVLTNLDRGDHMANWSPDEALPALLTEGRTPLLLSEGIQWVVHAPAVLARNHCFMTIGSRRRKPDGALDARVAALWISNGTGRDGRERRHAPKVGWCWAGNRHTWLGFASAGARKTHAEQRQRPVVPSLS